MTMKHYQHIDTKIFSPEDLRRRIAQWRILSKRIVFTNGCFDILHRGHIRLLGKAASFGDVLIVGVNSDGSVNGLKGPGRPVNNEADRSLLLAALEVVDAVVLFAEPTPLELIRYLRPDVLVKGGDYSLDKVVGAPDVLGWGGSVEIIPLENGYSTTGLIEKINRL